MNKGKVAIVILTVVAIMLINALLILPNANNDVENETVLLSPTPSAENAQQAGTIGQNATPSAYVDNSLNITESPNQSVIIIPSVDNSILPEQTKQPTEDKVIIADGFFYIELTDEIIDRITGLSYPADDSDVRIGYDELRYIHLLHYDFEGNVHEGELIVNAQLAAEVTEIFYELYKAEYPLTSVLLVDEYGEAANDDESMAANNTSAFNYRMVSGSSKLSLHSFGTAIDINPRLNPYVKGEDVSPENGAEYADRTKEFAGKIDESDLCYKLFTQRGWSWGGDFNSCKDYQHFSKDLGYERSK